MDHSEMYEIGFDRYLNAEKIDLLNYGHDNIYI